MVLPTNVDAAYADSGTDASQKVHQQHHDTIHDAVNAVDGAYADAVAGGFVGTKQAWLEQVGAASGADDQTAAEVSVAATPTNYTAATADVEAHLAGVDTALASVGGGAIRVEDEGVSTVAAATALNFAGAGVTVTDAGANEALVTIGGASTPAFSGVKLTKSATQSIADSAFTPITFDGETYDTASYHNNATNNSRITIPTTGYYAFTGNIHWATLGSVTNLIGVLYKNGVEVISSRTRWGGTTGVTADNALPVVGDLSLTAGDYVELVARQSSGAALNVTTACSFSCRFLGT